MSSHYNFARLLTKFFFRQAFSMVCSAFVAFSPVTGLAYGKGRQNGLFFAFNCFSLSLGDSTAFCGRIWCRPVLVVGVKVAVLA